MLVNHFRKIYEKQPLEIQKKAPILAAFIALFFTIIFLMTLFFLLTADVEIYRHLFFLFEPILLLVTLWVLHKKRYVVSVNMLCYFLLTGIMFRRFDGFGPEIANISSFTLNILFIVLIMFFFGTNKKQVGIFSGICLFVILLYFNTVLPPSMQNIRDLFISMFFFILITGFGFLLFCAQKKSASKTEELIHINKLLQEETEKRKAVEEKVKKTNEMLKEESLERQLIMEAMHENKQQLFEMVNCVPGAVYHCRPDSEWVFDSISDYIAIISGYSTSNYKYKGISSYRKLIHPEDIEYVEKTIQEAMENVEPFLIEYRIINADDQTRYCSERGKVTFSSEGRPIWLTGTIFDISERKFAEEEIKKVNNELQRIASTDALTQIPNRRVFMEYLGIEWKRMAREQKELSIILCDIDFFKLYNDNYGHQEGDKCLYSVAQAIKSVPERPSDLTARFGGEEFIIILPNTDAKGVTHIAEQIIEKICSLKIPHGYSEVAEYVTVSLGSSSVIPKLDLKEEELIKAADDALYKAKDQGRNQNQFLNIQGRVI